MPHRQSRTKELQRLVNSSGAIYGTPRCGSGIPFFWGFHSRLVWNDFEKTNNPCKEMYQTLSGWAKKSSRQTQFQWTVPSAATEVLPLTCPSEWLSADLNGKKNSTVVGSFEVNLPTHLWQFGLVGRESWKTERPNSCIFCSRHGYICIYACNK